MDDQGNLTLDFSSLDDLINATDRKEDKQPEVKNDKPQVDYESRFASLETQNNQLKSLLSNLVTVISAKDLKEEDKDVVDELDFEAFEEPDKIKSLVSTITKAVTEQVTKSLSEKFDPKLSVLDGVKMQNDLLSEYQQAVTAYPDLLNYNLGMQYLINSGVNLNTIPEYYHLAKKFGLANSKFIQSNTSTKNNEDNKVRNFPKKIEQSNVNTNTEKRIDSIKDAIIASLEELGAV